MSYMELAKSARRHGSLVSEIIYILLNLGVASAVLLLVRLDLVILAYSVVLLSKWRVLAVRPRYWWDNIQTNLLDMLFGISIVSFLWQVQSGQGSLTAQQAVFLQVIFAVLYAVWLIVLKPRTGKVSVQLQALLGELFAISALFSIAYTLPSFAVVIAMWIVGYISAQHVLNLYDEEDITLLSMVWALVLAELGWVAYHWTIAYKVVFTSSAFQIPQIVIIVGLLSFFSARGYSLYKEKKTIKPSELLWPGIFVSGLMLVILIFFNGYQN